MKKFAAMLLAFALLASFTTALGDRPDLFFCFSCGAYYRFYSTGKYEDHDTQHWPVYKCSKCKNLELAVESFAANHTGGTATCTEKAVCTVCNAEYGEPLGHDWVVHSISVEPSCTSQGLTIYKCERCENFRENFGPEPPGHDWRDIENVPATCLANGHTMRQCQNCDETEERIDDALGHTPGAAATCTTAQVCTRAGCGVVLTAALDHTPGAEATCTTDQVCTRTGCGEVIVAALGHTPGAAATCTTAQVCTREGCGEELIAALGHTPGAVATCTTAQICDVCETVLSPATSHDYAGKVTNPTCTKKGYTAYTCTVCGDSYTENNKSAVGHWYGLWTGDEGDTHSTDCRRCGYTKTVDCTPAYEMEIAEESAAINVCSVCGKMNGTQLAVLEAPSIAAIDANAIPRGELIVHGLANPFEGAIYALTAAYEYAGKIEPLNGRVSITVPLDLEEGIAFKVVRVDAATETETEEVRTEVPFTYEDGKLTFETDLCGLFLLVPVV